jgi:hypothetical protein
MAVARGLRKRFRHVEPDAIVAYDEFHRAISLAQLDPDVLRPRMPHNVGQRLLNHAEARNRLVAWYIVQVAHHIDGDAGALPVLFRKPS